MPCAVLIGNYGVGNFGDDALERYFLSTFTQVRWMVISAKPRRGEANSVPRLPFGMRSLFMPWWKTIAALARADIVIFGGGSLFTDVESIRAVFLWSLHALVAFFFGKPVLLAFQGIGPHQTWVSRWIVRWVLSHAASISVRDALSADFVKTVDSNTKVVQTFDPILQEFSSSIQDSIKNVFIIIPRENSPKSFVECSVREARRSCEAGECTHVRIVLLKPEDPEEKRIAMRIQSSLGQIPCQIIPVRSMREMCTALEHGRSVITQRYHGALAALAQEVPLTIVPQYQGDKLDALQRFIAEYGGTSKVKALELIQVGEREMHEFLSKYF